MVTTSLCSDGSVPVFFRPTSHFKLLPDEATEDSDRVPQVSYPSCRGAGCGLGGRDHGCVAHCGWCPQGQCQARSLVRDGGALTPLADSKTVSAVSHPGQSLQSVQHTNYVRQWAAHCHLRRQSHARGDILHVRGPLGQAIARQVNRSGPSQGLRPWWQRGHHHQRTCP